MADDVAFTGDGLKFTFDLSLPGKRASRKSPNPRKVRTFIYSHYHSCIEPQNVKMFIISSFSNLTLPVWSYNLFGIVTFSLNPNGSVSVVRLRCVQIEVIHDYQESRSCVSYSLEGEDSPDLLKR